MALTLDIQMERVVGGAGESCWICGPALCDACLHMIRVGSPVAFLAGRHLWPTKRAL